MEASPPYDRIKLSKALGSSAEELALRPTSFYKNADIEVMTSTEAVRQFTLHSTLDIE
jgi:NAD(P)H-nitrite reductase large subunit